MVNYFFRVPIFAMSSHVDSSLFEPFLRMSRRTGRRWGALRRTFLTAAASRLRQMSALSVPHRRITAAPRPRSESQEVECSRSRASSASASKCRI